MYHDFAIGALIAFVFKRGTSQIEQILVDSWLQTKVIKSIHNNINKLIYDIVTDS